MLNEECGLKSDNTEILSLISEQNLSIHLTLDFKVERHIFIENQSTDFWLASTLIFA